MVILARFLTSLFYDRKRKSMFRNGQIQIFSSFGRFLAELCGAHRWVLLDFCEKRVFLEVFRVFEFFSSHLDERWSNFIPFNRENSALQNPIWETICRPDHKEFVEPALLAIGVLDGSIFNVPRISRPCSPYPELSIRSSIEKIKGYPTSIKCSKLKQQKAFIFEKQWDTHPRNTVFFMYGCIFVHYSWPLQLEHHVRTDKRLALTDQHRKTIDISHQEWCLDDPCSLTSAPCKT